MGIILKNSRRPRTDDQCENQQQQETTTRKVKVLLQLVQLLVQEQKQQKFKTKLQYNGFEKCNDVIHGGYGDGLATLRISSGDDNENTQPRPQCTNEGS